jgi:hypothetical protein
LSKPGQTIADPDLVDLHRFFETQEGPWQMYRFARSHPPTGATTRGGYTSYGTAGAYGATDEWFVSYSWLPIKTLFGARVMVISIVAASQHRSAIRVDTQVTWLAAKPVGDIIAKGASVLAAVLSHGLNPGEAGHRPVTTTDPAKIDAIRRFINHLGVVGTGLVSCPMDIGQYLTISFRKSFHERPFVVVVADVSGCEDVQVQQSGHNVQPALAGTGSGLVSFVERKLGFT